MGMRVDNGVDGNYVFTNCLFAKVRCGVDENASSLVFHHDRRTCTPVVRIAGMTHGAATADGRYAHRGAASQDGKTSPHFLSRPGLAGGLAAAVARAVVISIHAIRSSTRTFCRPDISCSLKMPFVFSCRLVIESIVCLAPIISRA